MPFYNMFIVKFNCRISLLVFAPIFFAIFLSGCVGVPRKSAVPKELSSQAQVIGAPNVRYAMDTSEGILGYQMQIQKTGAFQIAKNDAPSKNNSYLSISGGGENGAFGAGILVGWTKNGSRPTFNIVTGISAGALLAPFAFLGSEYDPIISEIYLSTGSNDIYAAKNIFSGILSDSIFDDHPLMNMLNKYIDDNVLVRVSNEYRRNGRLLLIGTTNLDTGQLIIWNMGEIASLDDPRSLGLFKKVMLASASVPVLFPPVMFDVEVNRVDYQEMHVDGGVSNQVFLYPIHAPIISKAGNLDGNTGQIFIIRNDSLAPEWGESKRWVVSIGIRSIEQIINRQGVGDLLRIYDLSKAAGMQFNLATIGSEFNRSPNELFDKEYMLELFEYGVNKARSGYPWGNHFPP
jgi:predicted patatin/cPLA2 family phospholipase